MIGWQWHQLDHMQSLVPCCRQITMPAPHHSILNRPDALPDAQQMVSKHLKQKLTHSFLGDQNGLPPTLSVRCLSVTLVYCGQTVAWIKVKLGPEVGLGPGHIVLHGDPAPPPQKKGETSPNFRPMSIVSKRSSISATAEHLFYLIINHFSGPGRTTGLVFVNPNHLRRRHLARCSILTLSRSSSTVKVISQS